MVGGAPGCSSKMGGKTAVDEPTGGASGEGGRGRGDGGEDRSATGGRGTGAAGTGGIDTGGMGGGGSGGLDGPGDAAPSDPDAGSDGSQVRGDAAGGDSPCGAGVAFCDDFESYPTGAAPAGKWYPAGTPSPEGTFGGGGMPSKGFSMTVDGMHAFSGSKAFHVSVKYTGNGYAAIYMGAKSGITGDTAYARFMMYQASWDRPHPDTVPGIHARLFFVSNASVDLDFSPTVFAFETGHDGFGPRAHMGPKPILNRWICVTAEFAPRFAFTVDGMSVDVPQGSAKGLQTLELGISSYRTFSTDFWIDDLVVDSKPLECPRK